LGIPNDNHVLRHVPLKKLFRDDEGNIHGLLPQAFELRPQDNKKLSVNWLEYFEEATHQDNIESTIKALRLSRGIKNSSNCAYGVGNIEAIKDTCKSHGATKVDVVHSGNKGNKSHSSIIRLPEDDLSLMTSLAEEIFTEVINNKSIP